MYTFHLPLPAELHDMLRQEAERSGEAATILAREALRAWLILRRTRRLHAEIAAFASEHAGTDLDLDENLEWAGIESVLGENPRRGDSTGPTFRRDPGPSSRAGEGEPMQYVEQQLVEFKAEFAKRRKRQILVSLSFAVVILLYVALRERAELSFFDLPPAVAIGVMFGAALAAVSFSLWNWRCPACNKYLGKGVNPSFCPKCGVPLK